jgi:hypothetical protein
VPARAGIVKIANCVDAINTFYGRPNIPIGIVKHDWEVADYKMSSMYVDGCGKNYPNDIGDTSKVPEACKLYQQILTAQPDTSVTMIITGYPTNLSQMLLLPGGMELARKKIKMVVQMGGWNQVCCGGTEGNLRNTPNASRILVDSCPAPIVYSGFTVGAQINSGDGFRSAPSNSPARYAYSTFSFSRSSWDPCATLFALAGVGPANCYFTTYTHGYQTYNPADGSNHWNAQDVAGKVQGFTEEAAGKQAVILKTLDSIYALPPSQTTSTAPYFYAANHSKQIVTLTAKSNTAIIPGLSLGVLEMFDEAGRMCRQVAIVNGHAEVRTDNLTRGAFLYRLKQGNSIVASGTMALK